MIPVEQLRLCSEVHLNTFSDRWSFDQQTECDTHIKDMDSGHRNRERLWRWKVSIALRWFEVHATFTISTTRNLYNQRRLAP